jgi:hypothetical protein
VHTVFAAPKGPDGTAIVHLSLTICSRSVVFNSSPGILEGPPPQPEMEPARSRVNRR